MEKLVAGGKGVTNRRKTGAVYEEKAAEYLTGLGYEILERNYRCRIGELDLIAREGQTLVFLEVKYRRTATYGEPAEAVGALKQRTICRVADFYRMTHRVSEEQPCRFDVVAVLGEEIFLYRNAFSYR